MRSNGIKPLLLNSAIVALCSVPKVGWLCFIAMALVYLWAAFRYVQTKRNFLIGALTPIAASAVYFGALLFDKGNIGLDVYALGLAAIQILAAATMVAVAHFVIWKPSQAFIKAGV